MMYAFFDSSHAVLMIWSFTYGLTALNWIPVIELKYSKQIIITKKIRSKLAVPVQYGSANTVHTRAHIIRITKPAIATRIGQFFFST